MTKLILCSFLLFTVSCSTHTVIADNQKGVAVRIFATASHVVRGAKVVKVGNLTCDVIYLTEHDVRANQTDGVALLLPRGLPYGGMDFPRKGDSGNPIYDYRGRLKWITIGQGGKVHLVSPLPTTCE